MTVDIESPATGQLGESGIAGHVDNRWGERIGAALLLSLIDDSVRLVIQNKANESNALLVPERGQSQTTEGLPADVRHFLEQR